MLQNHSSLIPASTVSYLSCYGNKPVVAGLIVMHYLNKSLEDVEGEIWKDVIGYEGVYKISNLGRVKSTERLIVYATGAHRPTKGGILFQRQPKNKYLLVGLWLNHKEKKALVHRLVAQAFVSNPEGKLYVNHKDGNVLNNDSSNLEWVTAKENTRHLIEVLGFNFKTMSKS